MNNNNIILVDNVHNSLKPFKCWPWNTFYL